MYVDDIDDLEELEELRDEAASFLRTHPGSRQAQWDLEDIEDRIDELTDEADMGV
ncbi:hypothetical protein KIY81_gp16 [Mycobacterium phage Bugsy]|uniref:Uncharacterized protein n=1 Tax=Mycobacterium phage Bugsy TaxID=2656567 RepID=A0A649VEP3_9CAUD|nr:hypothetical protein KIY81_gp16 [Mycobacterium phage Bugsy]QGJ90599.1 hypothetical protein SEA_BUGSY_78 [Mycobacterium phage Bugsy]